MHFDDVAFGERQAGDHLLIEQAHSEGATRTLADDGEEERCSLARCVPVARRPERIQTPTRGLLELGLAQRLECGLECGDLGHAKSIQSKIETDWGSGDPLPKRSEPGLQHGRVPPR
jgi:hypothetical protein